MAPKLFVHQNDLVGVVDDEDSINGCLGLCLHKRSPEQQGFVGPFALSDIADRRHQHGTPFQRQSRQAHLRRKDVPILPTVQPFEIILTIPQCGGDPLFGCQLRWRAIRLDLEGRCRPDV